MRKGALILLTLLLLSLSISTAAAQEDSVTLRLSRDFGSGFGARIQGTFSFRVTGPDDLVKVIFLIDDETVGEDSDAPYRLQFRTNSYSPGVHAMSAIGVTADGREIPSNQIHREFLSDSESSRITIIILSSLAVVIVGGYALVNWIASRGQKSGGTATVSGLLGGTICPNCGRPYALHIWGPRLMLNRLDRCPHCGKWKLVRRVPPQMLQEAAEAFETKGSSGAVIDPPLSDEESLRRQLDDSRFTDSG